MTREQAVREARKRWGKRALIRASEHVSSPERRQKAAQRCREIREERDRISAEVEARLKELPWYQELEARRKALYKELKGLEGWGCYYKFTVGEDGGFCFRVHGQGDTWAEAFAAADARAKREREEREARTA